MDGQKINDSGIEADCPRVRSTLGRRVPWSRFCSVAFVPVHQNWVQVFLGAGPSSSLAEMSVLYLVLDD